MPSLLRITPIVKWTQKEQAAAVPSSSLKAQAGQPYCGRNM